MSYKSHIGSTALVLLFFSLLVLLFSIVCPKQPVEKYEDSGQKVVFSFCVAEFPQFVNIPIPVHLHVIPGNCVRLPFTPLPRHQ